MVSNDVKFEFTRFDGARGEHCRRWRCELFNFYASKVNQSGSSLADYLLEVDMGGAGAVAQAMSTAAGEVAKTQRLKAGRARAACGVIVSHISDTDLVSIISANHFQHGVRPGIPA